MAQVGRRFPSHSRPAERVRRRPVALQRARDGCVASGGCILLNGDPCRPPQSSAPRSHLVRRATEQERWGTFEYPNVPDPSRVGRGESAGHSTEEVAMDPRSAGCIPPRQHIRRGLAAGLPAAVVLALLAGCATGTADQPEPSVSEPVATDEPEAPTATPTETPAGETVTITAYYPLDTRAGFRLGREAREVPAADALVGAVETMIAGPLDPDYGAVWNVATDVQGVSGVVGGVVTVDLSADARTANVGSALAGLMIQQLVYTVTDAARDPP